jgi:hypothetical protein
MLVIPLPRTEIIIATGVILLFVVTALAYCCLKQTCRTTSDRNTSSNDEGDEGNGRGMHCYCCRKKPAQTRAFATLNDLLLEVDTENETGWVNVVSTPRSASDNAASTLTTEEHGLQFSVESFFPDILVASTRKKGRGRNAARGSTEETLL